MSRQAQPPQSLFLLGTFWEYSLPFYMSIRELKHTARECCSRLHSSAEAKRQEPPTSCPKIVVGTPSWPGVSGAWVSICNPTRLLLGKVRQPKRSAHTTPGMHQSWGCAAIWWLSQCCTSLPGSARPRAARGPRALQAGSKGMSLPSLLQPTPLPRLLQGSEHPKSTTWDSAPHVPCSSPTINPTRHTQTWSLEFPNREAGY